MNKKTRDWRNTIIKVKMRVLVNVEGTVTAETVWGEVTETDQNSVKMGDLCL